MTGAKTDARTLGSGRAVVDAYLRLPRHVYVLCLGTFVNRAGTFVMPFLALYLSNALGFEPSFATLTIGVFGGASVLAAVIGGALADRIGRRAVMIAALVGGGSSLFLFTHLHTKAQVLAGVALFAVLTDLYRPAAQAMMSDLTSPEERPRAFSLLYVSVNLGFAVGAVVGGTIAALSFQWLFWLDAATSFVFAVLILFALPETLARRDPRERHGKDEASHREAIRHMVQNGPFVALCAGNFLAALVFHQAESTVPIRLAALGITSDVYGRIMAVNGVLIVILQLPLTHVLTGSSRGAILAAGAMITGIGFAATGLFSSPIALGGTVAVWTLGEILMAAFHSPVVSDLAPERFRGRYFGAVTGTFGLAMMLGPPFGGLVLERFGDWLWGLCFIVCAASAVLLLAVRRGLDAK
jgi:MFS family permease